MTVTLLHMKAANGPTIKLWRKLWWAIEGNSGGHMWPEGCMLYITGLKCEILYFHTPPNMLFMASCLDTWMILPSVYFLLFIREI